MPIDNSQQLKQLSVAEREKLGIDIIYALKFGFIASFIIMLIGIYLQWNPLFITDIDFYLGKLKYLYKITIMNTIIILLVRNINFRNYSFKILNYSMFVSIVVSPFLSNGNIFDSIAIITSIFFAIDVKKFLDEDQEFKEKEKEETTKPSLS
jgi:hypothetical protein